MLDKKTQNLIIPENFSALRLDQALAKLLTDYSRTQIQEWLLTGKILVNNLIARPKYKVKGGEQISLNIPAPVALVWQPENIPLNIIFEDEALLIINKPVGMVVHPGAGNSSRTLLNALLHHHEALEILPRAGIVHRLDKETSGLLVVAKTTLALKRIAQQLKKRSLLREYQAIVYGTFVSGGKIDAPIDRHPLQRKRMCVSETGKPAITHYRIIERYRNHTRLKVQLETGRTYQIRVHMAHIQHPIVGDPVYGGRVQLAKKMTQPLIQILRKFKHQALHAFSLGLSHPLTQEWMQWKVDLPSDMQHLIALLKEDHLNDSA